MKFERNKEKTLVDLIKDLSELTPDWRDKQIAALRKGYGGSSKLDKEVYRLELNKYIKEYSS